MNGRKWTLKTAAAVLLTSVAGAIAQPPTPPVGQTPPPGPGVTPASLTTPAATPTKAATVNGEVITMADLEAVLKQHVGPVSVQLPAARARQIQLDHLAAMIDDRLWQQFLKQNAPPVARADVERKIAEIAGELKKQNRTFQDLCKDTNQTEAQLVQNIQTRMQWEGYTTSRVKDEEIQRYYADNKDFFDKVTVQVSHVCYRISPTTPPAELAQLKAKLADVRKQILEGKLDFAEAAKQHSQDQSAAKGGLIGYIPRKFVVEESFARAAFALKVGEVSDVVQTEFGLHLIKVGDRKAGEASDYAKIKEDVREFYMDELFQTLLAQQRKAAKIDIHLP